ncbi:phage virion morphogenesis protein [Aliivibrio sp. S4TY2]|uniref:phage virion morphogenesis protein n=1 Tax=unclassified Aliivibrio TaxID=2645654 RepID=UPI002378DDAC|nr:MULTISPECIES: phage virion morphogenesis protein [unclassified Aliivibrio]MDD9154943.1 phage virion morphogenesis protein [Aliivibrio sp. S4TY2]MDD9158694.1 phage virion morphogenesis protein [Aliivibrio sp. S4TY1]MDD9162946.1 phage virion morphogenesis protein [Aliivibrio sp. S4MY2]MDD9166693.1 phage virion morphogenesis protein [Aliivibrio sp. S4MY4]MDD9184023.1 phage virion morphogenesis protein [Aliivibrio sp. S4MY3]
MQLTSPEQLSHAINNLLLTDAEAFELNRRLANRSRQFFRQQIRQQRDIDGKAYKKRARRKITLDSKTKKAKDNKNMLLGFGRALRTRVSKDDFEVGLAGVVGNMAKVHNEGKSVSFTTRVKGYYNSNTSRWEGGTAVKRNYKMPKRTIIGWTPSFERELLAMVAEHYKASVES